MNTTNYVEPSTKPEIRVITRSEAEEYILSQDPTRVIDFTENYAGEECGCLMIHIGESQGLDFTFCGTDLWLNFDGQHQTAALTDGNWKYYSWGTEHETYATLQVEVIRQRENYTP